MSRPRRDPRDGPSQHARAALARIDWNALEDTMHRDPGGRGLPSYRGGGAWLDHGQLRAAALHLAVHARAVGIATGFSVVSGARVTAETDGPPGALFLAQVLASLSVEVTLITDRPALPLLDCGLKLLDLRRASVVEFPIADEAAWIEEFLVRGRGCALTHLISIERAGPCHTLESLRGQPTTSDATEKHFLAVVPQEDRDRCHDMHGGWIDSHTARIHRLFEAVDERALGMTTIGIGDGGNEIGMGRFAWEDLVAAIGGGASGRIACRIATDFAIVAGVSNWGAYALALAVARLRGGIPASRWLEPQGQRELIETLVAQAGAVDGRTLRAEPTVDGLAMDDYLRPLHALRDHCTA